MLNVLLIFNYNCFWQFFICESIQRIIFSSQTDSDTWNAALLIIWKVQAVRKHGWVRLRSGTDSQPTLSTSDMYLWPRELPDEEVWSLLHGRGVFSFPNSPSHSPRFGPLLADVWSAVLQKSLDSQCAMCLPLGASTRGILQLRPFCRLPGGLWWAW